VIPDRKQLVSIQSWVQFFTIGGNMAIKRMVDIDFWNDDKVVEVFSPEDRYFMLYLLTNPHTTQLGIYQVNKKVMAFETGYSTETITTLIDRFQNKYKLIHYNRDTNEIGIVNYLKHSIVKGGKPVEDLLVKELGKVKDRDMIDLIFNNIEDYPNLNVTVKQVINNYKNKSIHNDNDNENEVSYHDSYNDSYNDSLPPKPKPIKELIKFGEIIKMTQEEYDKLIDKYGNTLTQQYIDKVDLYCQANGKSYKSYYATVIQWVTRDIEKDPKMKYAWQGELKAEQEVYDAQVHEAKRDKKEVEDIFSKL
jgi:hypothetical protein